MRSADSLATVFAAAAVLAMDVTAAAFRRVTVWQWNLWRRRGKESLPIERDDFPAARGFMRDAHRVVGIHDAVGVHGSPGQAQLRVDSLAVKPG